MSHLFNDAEIDEQHRRARILLARSCYAESSVLKACYWLSNDLWFQIEDLNDRIALTVGVRHPGPSLEQPRPKPIEEWLPTLFNALADAQVRAQIEAETSAVRELIIAKAFAEAGVLEDPPPGTFDDRIAQRKQPALVRIDTGTSQERS